MLKFKALFILRLSDFFFRRETEREGGVIIREGQTKTRSEVHLSHGLSADLFIPVHSAGHLTN